jgi:hypothetical protein
LGLIGRKENNSISVWFIINVSNSVKIERNTRKNSSDKIIKTKSRAKLLKLVSCDSENATDKLKNKNHKKFTIRIE